MADKKGVPDGESPDFSFLGNVEANPFPYPTDRPVSSDPAGSGDSGASGDHAASVDSDPPATDAEFDKELSVTKREVRPASSAAPQGSPPRKGSKAVPTEQVTVGRPAVLNSYVIGYAMAVTIFLLFCLLTGRLTLTGASRLESLPDVRPLNSNEFQRIPEETQLPDEHVLQLGESRRFGDVVVKPLRVTREPLKFEGFLNAQPADELTTEPLLKLWIEFASQADGYRFPPYDAFLMTSRSPAEAVDDSAAANSFLLVASSGNATQRRRILNYPHSPHSNFIITGQNSGSLVEPGVPLTTFVACSDQIREITADADNQYVWRIQFRKGVHVETGHGVTTLIDVHFQEAEIEKPPVTTESAI